MNTTKVRLEQYFPTAKRLVRKTITLKGYSHPIRAEYRMLPGRNEGYTNILINSDLWIIPVGGRIEISAK